MYPISIIEKREKNRFLPGVVFTGRRVVHLKREIPKKGIISIFKPLFFNLILTVIVAVTIIFLYAIPFARMDAEDREIYLQLALRPASVSNQQPLLDTLYSLGVITSVANFDSNISIVTVTGFHDTRSLLSTVESFEGVLAIQNSVNGFQIKVVRGIL